MVSGAVALMLQAAPGLTPDLVKIRLMHSAIKQWNPAVAYDAYSRGAGLLNVPNALQETVQATQYAASPTIARGSITGQGRPFRAAGALRQPGDLGDQALWGNRPWADQALWSDNIVWHQAICGAIKRSGAIRPSGRDSTSGD